MKKIFKKTGSFLMALSLLLSLLCMFAGAEESDNATGVTESKTYSIPAGESMILTVDATGLAQNMTFNLSCTSAEKLTFQIDQSGININNGTIVNIQKGNQFQLTVTAPASEADTPTVSAKPLDGDVSAQQDNAATQKNTPTDSEAQTDASSDQAVCVTFTVKANNKEENMAFTFSNLEGNAATLMAAEKPYQSSNSLSQFQYPSASGLGDAGNFSVFANTYQLEGSDMEGSVAVQKLVGDQQQKLGGSRENFQNLSYVQSYDQASQLNAFKTADPLVIGGSDHVYLRANDWYAGSDSSSAVKIGTQGQIPDIFSQKEDYIDFSKAFNGLKDFSKALSETSSTFTQEELESIMKLNQSQSHEISCHQGKNVLRVTKNQMEELLSANLTVELPDDSSTLAVTLDESGTGQTFTAGARNFYIQVNGKETDSYAKENGLVLFNFGQATAVDLTRASESKGMILAPWAAVSVKNQRGNVVGDTVTNTAEIHQSGSYDYLPKTPDTPVAKTYQLNIRKTATGLAGEDLPKTVTFRVTDANGGDAGTITAALSDAESGSYTANSLSLSNGTYSLTEEDATVNGISPSVTMKIGDAPLTKGQVTVQDKDVTVDVTNAYSQTPAAETGSLIIHKTVTGLTGTASSHDFAFSIMGKDFQMKRTVSVTGNQTQSVTLENLTPGEYTVTETGYAIDGYTRSGGSQLTQTVTVSAGETAQAADVTFVNHYTPTTSGNPGNSETTDDKDDTPDTPSTHDDETDIPDNPTPGGEKPDDPTPSADQPSVPGDITIPESNVPKADTPSAPAEIAEKIPPLAEAPETGDHQRVLISAAVSAASLAGIISLCLSGRKRRKNNTDSMRNGN